MSDFARIDGVRFREPLAMAPLATWFAAFGGLPAHTELALRVATYDAEGRAVATSRITWDCTTGTVLSLEQRGNARGDAPPTARVVEFHHAALDHWFMSADAQEIARLDTGATAGWQRTGYAFAAYTGPASGTQPVCRFYLPPTVGDSHFYSASPDECADVAARFPAFVAESAEVFRVALPDAAGVCPPATVPVYRLWNARADSNHRYTTDAALRRALVVQGYVAEGAGPDAVAMCALP